MIAAVVLLFFFGCVSGEMPMVSNDNPYHTPKIVNGQNASEGEFPYMASLRLKNVNNKHICGGSILTKRWMLTAGHCCERRNQNDFMVYTGSIYLDRGGSYHAVDEVVVHSDYSPKDYWKNDMCLIRVSDPFNFSCNVQQITVPPENWPVIDGDKLTISGWGFYTFPDKDKPNHLQKADTFVAVNNEKCGGVYGVSLTDEYLCAVGGVKGQGVCHGDSGGPLVKNKVLVGVVSWGNSVCGSGYPDVFARVPHYISWFKKILKSEFDELKFLE